MNKGEDMSNPEDYVGTGDFTNNAEFGEMKSATNTADKVDIIIDKLDQIISMLEDLNLYEEMKKVEPWRKDKEWESWP